jgi:thiamine biosynthesis protein ThiS
VQTARTVEVREGEARETERIGGGSLRRHIGSIIDVEHSFKFNRKMNGLKYIRGASALGLGMDVIVNGEPATVPAPLTVAGLLAHLDIDARRVAVELNEAVIKRALYEQTSIHAGDAVEIVNFVGGG